MKTVAIKGFVIPLFITWLCLIFLVPNNVMAQDKPVKNVKTVRVERAVEVNKGTMAFKLTDDQKAKMKDLRLEHAKAIRLLKAQSQELVAHLKTLNMAEKPDNKAIFKTIDEMMANRGEIMKRTISAKQAFKAILTPEQLKALQLRELSRRSEMGRHNNFGRRQGNRNFGHRQMMQRGGMNRPGQMMQHGGMNRPGQMMQGGQMQQRQMMIQKLMMNRQGQGFGGGHMMPQGQMQRRFQVIKEGQPKTPDTTTVK